MPITAADIEFRLSGGAANADPAASLGGAKSSVEIVDATLHNLFDIVGGDEGAAGDIEYRCFYVHNAHATLTLQNAKIHIESNSPSEDSIALIGLGTAAIDATEPTIADENAAPADVTFSTAAGLVNALTIGNLGPGQSKSVWVLRNITAGAAAYNNDGVALRISGETAA